MTPVGMALGVVLTAVAFSDDLRRRHERILRDAFRMANLTISQASQEAEIDQAQLTRQLGMQEGTHKRLVMQPVAFWQWLAVAIAKEFGLPAELERAARLERATKARKRMARADAPAEREAKVS